MKILFLSHYPHLLGANRSLFSLVVGLRDKGVLPQVWCPEEGDFTEALRAENIKVRIFPYHNWAATFMHPSFFHLPFAAMRNNTLLPTLALEAKEFGPNIIHTNSSVLGIGAQIAEEIDIPHVWHIREFAWLQYQMKFFPNENILFKYLKKAKKAIAISHAIKNGVGKNQPEINWEIVYNGVLDENKMEQFFEVTANEEKESDTFTFLCIGLLHPAKGQLEAVEAFGLIAGKYPRARLRIVGEGRRIYEAKLKEMTKRKRITKQVDFVGFKKEVAAEYHRADAVLMCSRDEGMGRVTVEAMSYGKPVLGYRGGATPELLTDTVDGFLYEDSAAGLAEKMELLLSDPVRARAMGKAGQQKAIQNYTIQKYVDHMYDLFREVYPF